MTNIWDEIKESWGDLSKLPDTVPLVVLDREAARTALANAAHYMKRIPPGEHAGLVLELLQDVDTHKPEDEAEFGQVLQQLLTTIRGRQVSGEWEQPPKKWHRAATPRTRR